jgi:phosphatidylglycerol:prolipoprotein diacylglycerol transferase
VNWLVVAAVIAYGAPAIGAYLRENGSPAFQEGLPLFGYGFMLFIGFTSAVYFAARRAQSVGLSSDGIWDLAMWLIFPGIVGARVFYLIQYGNKVFGGIPASQWPVAALNLSQGGIVLYGALLGGAAGYFTFCYVKRVRPLGLADIIIPSVFVGIGFGRIGCFLNGCCYGRMTTLPWGVSFPKGTVPFESLVEKHLLDAHAAWTPPLHPTQIYSSIDGFVIAAITSWYFWHRRRNGEVLAVALVIYPITRFCMELLRGDENGKFGTTLTISQWISIALFLVNIGFMVYLSKRPAVREPVKLPQDVVGPHSARATSVTT